MTFQLIQAFLGAVLQLGELFGAKLGDKFDVIMAALNAGRALIAQGGIGADDLRKLTAEIQAIVAAGVEPSSDQINSMKARFNSAYQIAQKYLDDHPEHLGPGEEDRHVGGPVG